MINIRHQDNQAVIAPTGQDIVAATVPELRSKMQEALKEGARDLVVDLFEVQMVDSTGIGLLIAAHNSLRALGGTLAVIHASADILELFQTMRMHKHFSVSG